MPAARPYATSSAGSRFTDGWRTAAWVVVVVGVMVIVFAGIIIASAINDGANESGGDDSLAPLGFIIAAVVAAPAVVALGMVWLSFVRQLPTSARKALVFSAAALLTIEIFVGANWFA